jgi:hypothetical protein
MKCSSEWNSQKRPLGGSQVHDLVFCRTLNYYVDSSSTELIELGTKKYPFKNLMLPFIEILNFHSNSQADINIYAKERSEFEVLLDHIYLIKINKVTIKSYSDVADTPANVEILLKDENVEFYTPKTAFNIFKDSSFDLSSQLSNSNLTTLEKSLALTSEVSFMTIRSSLEFEGVSFNTEFSSNTLSHLFFMSIYSQSHTLTLKNWEIKGSGSIFKTQDPTNFYAENLDIDYYRMTNGFNFQIDWNYTDASKLNDVKFDNITVYNSKERAISMTDSFILFDNAANFTLTNSNINIYGSSSEDYPAIKLRTIASCNPDDGVTQNIIVESSTFTLHQDSSNDRFVNIYVNILETYIRDVAVSISGIEFENISMNSSPLIEIYANQMTSVSLDDISLGDSSFQDSVYYFSNALEISLSSLSFYNITEFGNALVDINEGTNIEISNWTIQDCDSSSESEDFYIYASSSQEESIITINNFTFSSTNIGARKAIRAATIPQFNLVNSSFMTVSIGSENSLISLDSLSELNLESVNFAKITPETSQDDTPLILDFVSLNASKATDLLINNVIVSESDVAFLYLDKIVDYEGISKTFTISNFQYTNSYFSYKNNILTFTGMEYDTDFTITLSDIKFTNVSFYSTGNLLLLEQQLKNELLIPNLYARDIKNGHIYIETYSPTGTLLPTKVKFTNLTTDYINIGFRSFITVYESAEVSIYNSTIQYWFTTEEGGVLRAGSQRAIVNIYNSVFQFNSAIKGGVFYVESTSVIKLYNSNVTQNFGVSSGVIQAENHGYFEFYDSFIFSNNALAVTVAEIFDVALTPIISGCQIYSNVQLSKSTITTAITNSTNWSVICWLKTEFKNYLIANPSYLEQTSSLFMFQTISSSFTILGDSTIYTQPRILTSFVSTVTIQDSAIKSTRFSGSAIVVTTTTLNLNNMTMTNLTSSSSSSIILTSQEAVLNINTLSYSNSTVSLYNLLSSSGTIENVSISKITTSSSIMKFEESTNATVKNVTMSSWTSYFGYNIRIKDSYIHEISDLSITTSTYNVGYVFDSTITLIERLYLGSNSRATWLVYDSVIGLINDSNIYSNGMVVNYSGTISFYDSNVTMANTAISLNKGLIGGGIYLSWATTAPCISTLTNVTISNNYASYYGAAIYYDVYRPIMTNVTFVNNTAASGNDIYSYPVRIVTAGTTSSQISIDNVASGQVISASLTFSVVDADSQLLTTVEGKSITISSIDSNTSVLSGNTEEIVNGVATFNSLSLLAYPGAKNVKFKISSTAIDSEVLLKQYGTSSFQDPLYVSFRYWEPGEVEQNNQWEVCSSGSYSLEWNSTECTSWMDNAQCFGGTEIYIEEGFWRSSLNSTSLISWLREEAWEGGYEEDQQYPVNCKEGYEGILWTDWQIIDGNKYERLSNFECSKCPDLLLNAIRILGLIILVWTYFILLIIVILKKKKESQPSILLRIMSNYLQLLTAALSFDMKFPKAITQAFYPIQRIGSSGEAFLSFDCFVRDTEMKAFTPSTAIFKILLTGLLPVGLIFFSFVIWQTINLCFSKYITDIRRNVIVTATVILFLMHPMLTKVGFEIFQWVKVDEGKFQVKIDLEIECFSWEHMKWSLLLAVPIIIVWVIGAPLLMLIILIRNRHVLHKKRMTRYFLLFYQGLHPRAFYRNSWTQSENSW